MICKDCCERLSDFLLDELPEYEAVVVQEHLNLCPDCMATYKELKGTGRALEAIPALRPAPASPQFGQKVLTAARLESEKIIKSLPPEKRLRMEARRPARLSPVPANAPVSQQRTAISRSKTVVGILSLGALAAAFILLYPGSSADNSPGPVGTLTVCVGKAEQFYQRAGERWSAVVEGTQVNAEDEFATREEGRIRIDLQGGGSLLMGPSSELKFRRPASKREVATVSLVAGELGLELPLASVDLSTRNSAEWVLRTETVETRVRPGSKVYLHAVKSAPDPACTVWVAQGQATVRYGARKDRVFEVKAGEGQTFSGEMVVAEEVAPEDSLIRPWRMDLLSRAELAVLLSPRARLVERRAGGLLVEFSCGFGHSDGLGDWVSNAPPRALALKEGGALVVPSGARFSLLSPLSSPISMEAVLNAETAKDASFAFAILDVEIRRVSVDVDHEEALLQVREPLRTTSKRLPCRPGVTTGERVRLELVDGSLESSATLITSGGRSPSLAVSKNLQQPGAVWFSALRDSLALEGIRVTGLVPRDWLLRRQRELRP